MLISPKALHQLAIPAKDRAQDLGRRPELARLNCELREALDVFASMTTVVVMGDSVEVFE